jgi:hypothetical protein
MRCRGDAFLCWFSIIQSARLHHWFVIATTDQDASIDFFYRRCTSRVLGPITDYARSTRLPWCPSVVVPPHRATTPPPVSASPLHLHHRTIFTAPSVCTRSLSCWLGLRHRAAATRTVAEPCSPAAPSRCRWALLADASAPALLLRPAQPRRQRHHLIPTYFVYSTTAWCAFYIAALHAATVVETFSTDPSNAMVRALYLVRPVLITPVRAFVPDALLGLANPAQASAQAAWLHRLQHRPSRSHSLCLDCVIAFLLHPWQPWLRQLRHRPFHDDRLKVSPSSPWRLLCACSSITTATWPQLRRPQLTAARFLRTW